MSEPVRRVKLERGDSVALIIRHLDSGQILLVEQFKYPTYGRGDGWIVETMAAWGARSRSWPSPAGTA